MVWRDSSAIKFDRAEIAFIWALFLLAEPLTDEGEEPEYLEKTHGEELQKMPHKAQRFKPQARLEPAQ